MIKAKIGEDFVFLGLTRDNIDALVAGRPIIVNLSDIEMQGQVAITFGETTEDLTEALRREIVPDLPHLPMPGPTDEPVRWKRGD